MRRPAFSENSSSRATAAAGLSCMIYARISLRSAAAWPSKPVSRHTSNDRTTRFSTPGGGFGFNIFSRQKLASVGRIQANLHLPAEPLLMRSHFPLLSNKITHEVTQQLRDAAVAGFRSRCKLVFQRFIDSECKSRFIHGPTPCVTDEVHASRWMR